MELNIHLDPESAKKLAYLQQYEAQDPASLLTKAIEQRYQSLCPPSESPYHVFEKLGLGYLQESLKECTDTCTDRRNWEVLVHIPLPRGRKWFG